MSAACYYSAGMNLGWMNTQSSLGTVIFRRAAGGSPITITLAALDAADFDNGDSSYFFHSHVTATTFWTIGNDPAETVALRHYSKSSLGSALGAAATGALSGASWPAGFLVTSFVEQLSSVANPHYEFTYSGGGTFTYQFSALAGARLFGVNSTAESSPATSHVLSTPYYVWWPSTRVGLQAISADGENEALDYEPEDIGSLVHADDSRGYMNSRTVSPLYRDFLQQGVAPARMFRLQATPPVWTAQHLYEHCRTGFPFVVANGAFGNGSSYDVLQLRKGTWKPRRLSVANAVYYDVTFKAGVIGRIAVAL